MNQLVHLYEGDRVKYELEIADLKRKVAEGGDAVARGKEIECLKAEIAEGKSREAELQLKLDDFEESQEELAHLARLKKELRKQQRANDGLEINNEDLREKLENAKRIVGELEDKSNSLESRLAESLQENERLVANVASGRLAIGDAGVPRSVLVDLSVQYELKKASWQLENEVAGVKANLDLLREILELGASSFGFQAEMARLQKVRSELRQKLKASAVPDLDFSVRAGVMNPAFGDPLVIPAPMDQFGTNEVIQAELALLRHSPLIADQVEQTEPVTSEHTQVLEDLVEEEIAAVESSAKDVAPEDADLQAKS